MVYTDTGGPGPVLLMVHVGLWSMLWGGLIATLRDDFRCITLDVPGAGLSERTSASEHTLARATEAIGALIDEVTPAPVTLVVHDTGGIAALAAASTRTDRIVGVVGVNTFAWKPQGILWLALRLFGSTPMREVSTATGALAWGSATRFGVGRHMSHEQKRAWRRGLRDHGARRFTHRMFRSAATDPAVAQAAGEAIQAVSEGAILTVFGQLGDYFCFQRRWRKLRPDATALVVPWGLHFPMADNPSLVAGTIREWYATLPESQPHRPAR